MESMKRVDVLKGIEQILVQKAYETGHISHRADGDWQKTNNGWVRVKGSPAQSTSKEPDQVTLPNARKLTSDEIQELQQISDINERRKRQSEMLSQPAPAEEYGEITEEDLVETPDEDVFSEEAYAQDEEDRKNMTNEQVIDHIFENGDYDERIKNGIEFRDEGDGEPVPHDDDYFAIVDEIWSDNDGFGFSGDDFDDEDSEANQLYDYLVDKVTDRAYELHNDTQEEFDSNEDREFDSLQKSITKMYDTGTLKDDISQIPADSSGSAPDEKEVREFVNGLLAMHDMSRSRLTTDHLDSLEEKITDLWHKGQVGKSAVRDMRSTPAVKNMGF